MAAHEFGHLIGLADEYNRDEGQFLAVTGQEPPVGKVAGDPAKATQLAKDIKKAMPIADAKGLALATVVWNSTGGKQGRLYFQAGGQELRHAQRWRRPPDRHLRGVRREGDHRFHG